MKFELTEREAYKVVGCLCNEALKHKELSEDFKKQGRLNNNGN